MNIKRFWSMFGLMILALGLVVGGSGCAGSASAEPTPPTIHYGEDVCEFCGMIISDERFAAGYLTADGQEYIFDDIGDMVQHYLQQEQEVAAAFVHDYQSHVWIRAETAAYVLSPHLSTPMLSGLVAVSKTEEAQSLISQSGGETLSFDELLSHYQAKAAPAMRPHDASSMGHDR